MVPNVSSSVFDVRCGRCRTPPTTGDPERLGPVIATVHVLDDGESPDERLTIQLPGRLSDTAARERARRRHEHNGDDEMLRQLDGDEHEPTRRSGRIEPFAKGAHPVSCWRCGRDHRISRKDIRRLTDDGPQTVDAGVFVSPPRDLFINGSHVELRGRDSIGDSMAHRRTPRHPVAHGKRLGDRDP